MVNGLKCTLLIFFLLTLKAALAQQSDRAQQANIHVGLEFGMLFQSDLLLTLDQERPDTNNVYLFRVSPERSLRFGGYFRFDLFGRHSLETGLYQVQRRYRGTVLELETGDELASEIIRALSYEVPVLWAISVRLGDDTRLSNAFGVSFDFFPSDFGRYRPELNQDVMRRYWVLPGLKANVGFEHQLPTAGALYLGASFHYIFTSIGFMQLQYKENNAVRGYNFIELNGTYFSANLRYIFPARPM